MAIKKQDLDTWLDQVDYSYLNSSKYVPTEFALGFMNFIKLVNGAEGESHKTPAVHLAMLDKVVSGNQYIANLCFRGAAKALALDTRILTTTGWKTIETLSEGEYIFGEDGNPTKVLKKSEVFYKPMYRLHLKGGRTLDVSEDHINVIIHRVAIRAPGSKKTHTEYRREEITTKDLLKYKLFTTRTKTPKNPTGMEQMIWIPNGKPINYPEKDLPVDPYTLGVILGDGTLDRDTGYARITTHKDDYPCYVNNIPYPLGSVYVDKRNSNTWFFGVKGIGRELKKLGVNVHGDYKFIPEEYFTGSIQQRLSLLQGLLDTDGTLCRHSPSFTSNSGRLANDLARLVRSLGGIPHIGTFKSTSGKTVFRVSFNISLCPFRLERKANKWQPSGNTVTKVGLVEIEPIPMVPSQCLYVDNESHTFLAGDYVVTHNTTLFMEYLTLYLAVFHEIPGFGPVGGMIYIADSMENGAKNARKNIEFRYERSDFLKEWIPEAKFTDAYLEFKNKKGEQLGVKLFGATTGLRGTKIFGKRPVLCHIKGTPVLTDMGYHKVEDYYKKGTSRFTQGIEVHVKGMPHHEVVTPEHRYIVTSLIQQRNKQYLSNGKTLSTLKNTWIPPRWVEAKNLAIKKLLGQQRYQTDYICKKIDATVRSIPALLQYKAKITERNSKGQIVKASFVPVYEVNPRMLKEAWWWLYGLYLADGHASKNKLGFTIANTQRDTVGRKLLKICAELGYTVSPEVQKIGCYQVTINDSCIERFITKEHLGNSIKNIPNWVLQIEPRYQKQLLLGYIAGDGYIDKKHGQVRINSINFDAIYKLGLIAERLGLPYHIRHARTKEVETIFPSEQTCISRKQLEIRFSQNVKQVLGIDIEAKPSTEVFFKDGWLLRKVSSVEHLEELNEFIPIQTPDHTYQTLFGMSHNCVLDDLLSDEAANSQTVMNLIKDTIYKGVNHALDPTRRKVIFNGTPFNKDDILIEAVESGAWDVNVWPVCEKFPCSLKDFKGAWPDRFSYEYIKSQYDLALKTGKLNAFYQELMLRITSNDERLVQESEIRWYSRSELLKNPQRYNFYITTDFATSKKQTADDSVISVWAFNTNGDWFWVDGICEKQTMDKNVDDLFKFVLEYKPQSVGIETTGQQGAFIQWLEKEMIRRNIWFSFARTKNQPGIRPSTDKLTRFNMVVPWFKAGKIKFPEEMKESIIMGKFMQEIKLTTKSGIKGHDDCLDTISMLGYLEPWKPAETSVIVNQFGNAIYPEEVEESINRMDSYIV